LFETPYFCKDHDTRHFELARPLEGHPAVERFRTLARELGVVLPVSVFEHANNAFYNSLVMVDADGSVLGSYRKSHIPKARLSREILFLARHTGFKVFETRFAKLGVAICWDSVVSGDRPLHGADGRGDSSVSTAIVPSPGSESDSSAHWQHHAGQCPANIMPLVASNRIGTETGEKYIHDVLWLVLHRIAYRREDRRSRSNPRVRSDRNLRP